MTVTGLAHTGAVENNRQEKRSGIMSSTGFASAGRMLAHRARERGVRTPLFRSPPRLPGVRRSVTRNKDGSVTVAIVVRNRPVGAVLADMIDGAVLAAGVHGADALDLRDHLWTGADHWLATGDGTPGPLRAVA